MAFQYTIEGLLEFDFILRKSYAGESGQALYIAHYIVQHCRCRFHNAAGTLHKCVPVNPPDLGEILQIFDC